ncbi:hypothetical protein ABS735_10095 [Streptomyces sp. MMCC 100]|uniref:hypothetical protein n=1 Tax=Streptomyces sp. MMCC 100 TaxID=3163555 RepID=UPI003595607D
MSEPTPSQAEGERDDELEPDAPDVPHTTPSQAEGERDDEVENIGEEPEGREQA